MDSVPIFLKVWTTRSTRRIPNELKRCRRHRGLSQKEVADYLGFKNTTWISRWENGDTLPNLISALRLSGLYQIPVETLFGELARTAMENTFKKSVSMGVVLDE